MATVMLIQLTFVNLNTNKYIIISISICNNFNFIQFAYRSEFLTFLQQNVEYKNKCINFKMCPYWDLESVESILGVLGKCCNNSR